MHGTIPVTKLALARIMKGLNQTQVSVEADVCVPVLSAAERFHKEPSRKVKLRLEKYYARPWKDLYQRINFNDLM